MARLSLYWPIDRDGYHIKPAASGGTGPAAKTILGSGTISPSIVRNGGPLDFTRDCMKIDCLYQRLAYCPPTEQGAHDFVSRFGFLRAKRSEPVEFICDQIKVVGGLLSLKKSRDWEKLDLWLIDNRRVIRLNPELLEGDPPQLFFRPLALLDAIYLQFFEDMSGGANIRLCKRKGCGIWFKYGSGTLHRNTAQYCSPKCQKADAYARTRRSKP